MTEKPSADVVVRPLRPNDLERVIEIDHLVSGRARRKFFEKRLEAALAHQDRFIAIAVDIDETLAGFVIARLQGGEFGDTGGGAVLDVLGVDPAFRRAGLGRQLLDGVTSRLRHKDIEDIRTQVEWRDRDMIAFLSQAGFIVSPHQVLERQTGQEETAVSDPADDMATQPLDAGMSDYSDPDADDFEALSRDKVFVRSMTEADLEAVVRIDRKLTGRSRQRYYHAKLDETLNESGIRVSLVAEIDGAPAGFIMARVDYGEYGRAEPIAVMDTIGVDPDRRGTGIGDAVLSQLMANLDALRVERIRTRTAWNQFSLLAFLDSHGFSPAQQLVLRQAL